jgi:hypothetical protein
MEPTVRGARTESAIIRRGRAEVLCPKPQFRGCRAVVYHSKSSRRERNFWMQRREAENRFKRPPMSPETKKQERAGDNRGQNGLFRVAAEIRGLEGLAGGVRSQIRTGLRDQTGINRANSQIRAFFSNSLPWNGLFTRAGEQIPDEIRTGIAVSPTGIGQRGRDCIRVRAASCKKLARLRAR